MMKTIVEEKPISFKELEQKKIFSYVCELGRDHNCHAGGL